ncbi:nitrate- and nitrite sensing domain-containing protein [Streptosporangium fragile]|uniref:histidine kinase n=1 Tax=Streptosporangium fragile TaxID=46186 RepID=A0ABN3W114_9ACTN
MRVRKERLRAKVTALLVSLTALWAFTAWVTVREGLNMLGVATLDANVAQPSEKLLDELQAERRLSLVILGDPTAGRSLRAELDAQRKRTDAAGTDFRELARGGSVQILGSAALDQRLTEAFTSLDRLRSDRQAIDAGRLDRTRAAATFTGIISSLYRVYDSMATLDDKEIAEDTRAIIELTRALEILSQEDALAVGALTAGRLTDAERTAFTQLVGVQRFLLEQTVEELPEADRRLFRKLAAEEPFVRMRAMEDRLVRTGSVARLPEPVDAAQWTSVAQPVLTKLRQATLAAGDGVVERSGPVATGVVVRLSLAGGLGLLAVIASIVLSITTARALVQQLEKLRAAAWELAKERLPSVVERIGHGETVDVAAEAPPLKFGNDQIDQVGQAFNAVQQTAIKVAAEQAQLRRDIADILRNLARRTQSLVHRQLSVLDVMERRENDPQELRDLFRLDHLATRMRRYAENLLVLSGAAPGRAWREAVPMIDVVRGSLAEIEDYTRVDVMPLGDVSLDGRAVSDVIHLVAELVENAASFSPPYTTVQVGGHVVAHGYALEIEDRGLGMSAEDIAAANERIANPPELKLSGNARLGLYVVSRLAERHDIRVTFKASPYGGTTVVVLIPQELVTEQKEPEQPAGVGVPQARAASAGEMNVAAAAVAAVRDRGGDPPVADAPVRAGETAGRTATQVADTPVADAVRTGHAGGSAKPARAEGGASLPPVLPPPDTSHTPGGLPRRVPQTHLAAPLQEAEPAPAQSPPADADERSPEMIRAAMASFQDGTRRGRSDAARLLTQDGVPADEGGPIV